MDYLGEDTYSPPPATAHSPILNHAQHSSTLPPMDPQTPQPLEPPPYMAVPYNQDPYNGMPPPPQMTYPSLPALMAACQEHGRRHGYACVTSSNNYKRGIAYVRCDRGGEYVNHWNVTPETRVRKNRTRRLVGCKWKARAKRVNESGEWQLTMMHDKHNGHGPSRDLAAHPSLRQLPDDAVEAAKQAFAEGRSPKEVLELLKGWNDAVTAQDVYNLKAKIFRKHGGGRRGKEAYRAAPGPVLGSQAQEDRTVDPALRAQDANIGGLGGLQAAVAQMQGLPQAKAVQSMPIPNSQSPRRCACTCCEH
ncbi:MAG: hypothetical protein Q9163_004786 [Psora crenata]